MWRYTEAIFTQYFLILSCYLLYHLVDPIFLRELSYVKDWWKLYLESGSIKDNQQNH